MEANKDKLENALRAMPQYEPEAHVWEAITRELECPSLGKEAAGLPQYEPDEKVWEHIADALDTGTGGFRRWFRVAAVVLVVLGTGYGLSRLEPEEPPVYYSVEKQEETLRLGGESDTDKKFSLLIEQCQVRKPSCENRDFLLLKSSFETLRAATDQLRETAGSFNSEPELARQYRELEMEKKQIVEEIAGLI